MIKVLKLEKVADVFGQEHCLIQDDFAVGHLPLAAFFPKDVLPAAYVKVHLGLSPGPVHNEIGVDF